MGEDDVTLAQCVAHLDQAKASLREAVRSFGPRRANALCEVFIAHMDAGQARKVLKLVASLGEDHCHFVAYAATTALREVILELCREAEEKEKG